MIGRDLLVVSHVTHRRWDGALWAYAPYAREIDVWAELFEQVRIAAPCREGAPAASDAAFARPNVTLVPQRETGGESAAAKLRQLALLPALIAGLARAMRGAEAIHVRCPGNLGLLGAVLAPLFSRRLVAKYAGQWNGFPGEPLSVRAQRALLRSRWWRGPVTVYGRWPGQPRRVVPFFTSVLSEEQLGRARRSAAARGELGAPLRVLFVGRLSRAKRVDVLLAAARATGARCTIVGEGPEATALQALAGELGADAEFRGALAFDEVLGCYERADVLVLASDSEGWPKALAEAMAFGCVCIGSDRGLMPEMLSDGRGLVVAPGDAEALAEALRSIARDPGAARAMGGRAAEWAADYSLERLREALRELLRDAWGPLA